MSRHEEAVTVICRALAEAGVTSIKGHGRTAQIIVRHLWAESLVTFELVPGLDTWCPTCGAPAGTRCSDPPSDDVIEEFGDRRVVRPRSHVDRLDPPSGRPANLETGQPAEVERDVLLRAVTQLRLTAAALLRHGGRTPTDPDLVTDMSRVTVVSEGIESEIRGDDAG